MSANRVDFFHVGQVWESPGGCRYRVLKSTRGGQAHAFGTIDLNTRQASIGLHYNRVFRNTPGNIERERDQGPGLERKPRARDAETSGRERSRLPPTLHPS